MCMPRLVVSGFCGGAGKTTVSLGLARAFTRQGLRVRPFKKGPDYIDTAWLGLASRDAASTLDPYFMDEVALRQHFCARLGGADLALIEGNRGFFDGRDIRGSASTAEVARCLDAPVILVVDITKMTRTTAALVAGCKAFPGGERIAGVILNRSGGPRHASLARRAVEELAGVPVLGVLPRLADAPIFERRAGLVTVGMHCAAEESLERTADMLQDNVSLDLALALARSAPPLFAPTDGGGEEGVPPARVRIGVVRDDALWAYYEENLDSLRHAGAELVFLSLLDPAPWPEVDGLYLGGGDLGPYAATLAANTARKADIQTRIEAGMPVYAEHAGFFYLGEEFVHEGEGHRMTGVFPLRAVVGARPARLGYVEAQSGGQNQFHPAGLVFKGHEYHYAALSLMRDGVAAVLHKRAGGVPIAEPDGLVYKSAFGAAMQIFSPAVPGWAPAFAAAAEAWNKRRNR